MDIFLKFVINVHDFLIMETYCESWFTDRANLIVFFNSSKGVDVLMVRTLESGS